MSTLVTCANIMYMSIHYCHVTFSLADLKAARLESINYKGGGTMGARGALAPIKFAERGLSTDCLLK